MKHINETMGALSVPAESIDSIDWSNPSSVSHAFGVIHKALAADSSDEAKTAALFFKNLVTGFEAAVADMIRQDHPVGVTMVSALSASAQILAVFIGTLARANAESPDEAMRVIGRAAKDFCGVFVNMSASFAGINCVARTSTNLKEVTKH